MAGGADADRRSKADYSVVYISIYCYTIYRNSNEPYGPLCIVRRCQ